MDKTYNPHSIEAKWYQIWEQSNYFAPSGTGTPYCIMLPPPNVTGSLHMGHGFQHTLMDALIRYHRMLGYNTLWQPGTDHAGIATQMVVERQLLAQNLTRHDLGRETFIDRVWAWKQEAGGNISRQMRRTGASPDWSRECFTMDEHLSEAVREVFVRLYNEGLIYRGTRLVNWDPKLHTAISDLEVINSEEAGRLWHIRYPIENSNSYLTVATTRPETLLGDVAVAVNPEDERYQALIGKKVLLPLANRFIPIIADDYVDPAFGSGCVKITPAHDFNDYTIGQRHHLQPINIFTRDAKLNDHVPAPYRGLDRYAARERIVADLGQAGLIEKIEPHTLKVPRGDRSGEVIEPYLTEQWFMRMKPLAEPAITAVENSEVKFIPENWTKTYFQWLHNIEDWCISRQLWWGHRIPAWYDEQGRIYVGHNEAEVRQRHQLSADIKLTQDEDVLDTWFSSALWPFSTLGWPQQTAELELFYPTSVLVTGFDIIFFWVARMIMLGLKFIGQVPFKEVYVTGLIRDSEGQKMSKSKGNVLDPIDLIDGIDVDSLVAKRTHGLMQPTLAKKIEQATRKQYPEGIPSFGADALRFTFCALATNGRDIRFDLGRIEGYRNFCNKLWNAARFVLMNTEGHAADLQLNEVEYSLPDRWILSRLQQVVQQAHHYFTQYRFDLLAQILYEFSWNDYCDWYLELTKAVLNSTESSAAARRGTRQTLVNVLEALLRLMHPLMPFITEEIWQRIAPLANKQGPTIMTQVYPQPETQFINQVVIDDVEWLKTFIIGIRNIRGEMNISPTRLLPVYLRNGTEIERKRVTANSQLICSLARLESLTWLAASEQAPLAATALAGDVEILIPMAGLIDKNSELARLNKEIEKLQKDIERSEAKLNNQDYVNKAPAAVVEKERTKITELKSGLAKLEQQVKLLTTL